MGGNEREGGLYIVYMKKIESSSNSGSTLSSAYVRGLFVVSENVLIP